MQTEPYTLQPHTINMVKKQHKIYDLILAHDPELLLLDNCVLFQPLKKYFWVRPPSLTNIENLFHNEYPQYCGSDKYDYRNKKFLVTMLCGHKETGVGNRLRIKCWNKQEEITIPSRCYKSHTMGRCNTFKSNISTLYKYDKSEMFIDSMFHVAIENSSHNNYYTEKINDCIITHTVPIYWGCPNISDFYNTDGFVLFKDENDFIEKVNKLTPELYYSKIDAINENYNKFISIEEPSQTLSRILENHTTHN